DFTMREVTLVPTAVAAKAGAISGAATFSPSLADASAAIVSAFPVSGPALTAHANAAGAFSIGTVPPGLFRVEVALAGYSTAVVANVLVSPAQEVRLSVGLVSNGVSITPPPPPSPPDCVAAVRRALADIGKIGQV